MASWNTGQKLHYREVELRSRDCAGDLEKAGSILGYFSLVNGRDW